MGVNVYNSLRQTLETKGLTTMVSVEGGFSPPFASNKEAIVTLNEAILAIKMKLGFDIFLGIDAGSNNFFTEGKYHIKDENKALNANDLIDYYQSISSTYNLLYLEDGLADEDWEGWQVLQSRLSDKTIISGDDLTSTNIFRLAEAIKKNTINSLVIKPDQIGTVIESLAVSEMAKQANLKTIVSSRSGETNDDFLADFAVAIHADYTKFGAPVRGERVSKYNRLSQIYTQLKKL
jgi:enolase